GRHPSSVSLSRMWRASCRSFFYSHTRSAKIYPLSLHDALPICIYARTDTNRGVWKAPAGIDASISGARGLTNRLTDGENGPLNRDRKSTRLNSSHVKISYAVFCLKKKKRTDDIVFTLTQGSYDE